MRDVAPAEADRPAGRLEQPQRGARQSVVLPQPDSPTSPSVSPARDASASRRRPRARAPTSRSNSTPSLIGKCFSRCSTATSGSPSALTAPPPCRPAARSGRRPRARRAWPRRRASSGRGGPAARTRAPARGSSPQLSNACGQRGRKWQPSGRWISDGGVPGIDGRRRGRSSVEARDRAEQPPRVGVLGVVEDLVDASPCLDASGRRTSRARGRRSSATTPRSWVIRITAEPGSLAQVADSSRICAWIVTSSAVVGSSAISMLRSVRRAPSRSSRAGACRPRTRAGRRRTPLAGLAGCRPRPAARPRASRACGLGDVLVRADLLGDLLADPVDRVAARSSGPGRPSRSRSPRIAPQRRLVGRARARSRRVARSSPRTSALGERVSPISSCAVTDLPRARLADDRQHLAGAQRRSDTPSTACTTPSSVREATTPEVLDGQQRLRH